ncbi:MAG: hypothetical protein U1F43_09985 [Myxococcota bacterium]
MNRLALPACLAWSALAACADEPAARRDAAPEVDADAATDASPDVDDASDAAVSCPTLGPERLEVGEGGRARFTSMAP